MTATPAQRKAYLDALALGMTHKLASEAACVNHSTPYDWIAADPEYATKVEEAKGSRLLRHFGTVTKAAQAGDWRASVWLLSILHPDQCSTKRVEVTGKDGGAIRVQRPALDLSDDALAELAASPVPEDGGGE
jgi:hypothetical protein